LLVSNLSNLSNKSKSKIPAAAAAAASSPSMGARVLSVSNSSSSSDESGGGRRKLRSEGEHQEGSSPRRSLGGVTPLEQVEKKDDLLAFLDAEQDHLFLFPEEWHGDASTLGMEIQARQNKKQVFGCCGKVDNVDEVLRQAHADLKKSDSLRYTLVKRNPDGKSARVATEDDVKNLSNLMSTKAKVHQQPSKGQDVKQKSGGSNSSPPAKRAGSQYKPGGPCDHCGVTESPQWRRGPPNKPQLCNACGTRFRRTNTLGSPSQQSCAAATASSRKRGEMIRGGHRADKKPKLDKSLLIPVSA